MSNDDRGWLAELRRKYLHLLSGGRLKPDDLAGCIEGAERCADERDEARDGTLSCRAIELRDVEIADLRVRLERVEQEREEIRDERDASLIREKWAREIEKERDRLRAACSFMADVARDAARDTFHDPSEAEIRRLSQAESHLLVIEKNLRAVLAGTAGEDPEKEQSPQEDQDLFHIYDACITGPGGRFLYREEPGSPVVPCRCNDLPLDWPEKFCVEVPHAIARWEGDDLVVLEIVQGAGKGAR